MRSEFDLENKLFDAISKDLYERALRKNPKQAFTIYKATKILFPERLDFEIYDQLFDTCHKLRNHQEALKIFKKMGSPFWKLDDVGSIYEKRGFLKKAMDQYQRLIDEYMKMKILPLPSGPPELYKLGKWYQKKDPAKAKEYLSLYLEAEKKWKGDPAFRLPYKQQAKKLMLKLNQK